jgi:hypothetical protein
MMVMLAVSFFTWWYGLGWSQIIKSFDKQVRGVLELYSVGQLLRTLFSPWRRIISYPGASLADKWRAYLDNLFSRVIGFIVRLFVLLAAFISIIVVIIIYVIEVIAWPLLPLAIPGCLAAGLI